MKICILTTSTTAHQMGGTEVHAETIARGLAARGHEVTVITTAHPKGVREELVSGVTYVYLANTSHRMGRRDLAAWWRESSAKLRELSAAGLLDVILAEHLAGQYYARELRQEIKVPIASVIQNPGIMGDIASQFNRTSTLKEFLHFLTRYPAQLFLYYIPWFYSVMRYSDLVIPISGDCENRIRKEFGAVGPRIKKIFDPVDTALFKPNPERRAATRRRLGIADEETAIMMSGVVYKQKGMHIGLAAMALLGSEASGLKIIIAGDGPDLKELSELSRTLGLEKNTVFCGRIENDRMPAYYNAADIYLNPTIRHEGLAIVTIEAMACGLPCVVSAIGGTLSTIVQGESGLFVKPKDVLGIKNAIKFLLGNPAAAAEMGKKGRERALEFFSTDIVIDQYISALEQMTGGKDA